MTARYRARLAPAMLTHLVLSPYNHDTRNDQPNIITSGNVTLAQLAGRNQPDISNYLIQSVKFQLEYLIQKGYFHRVVR